MDNGQQPVGNGTSQDYTSQGGNQSHPYFANHPTQTFNSDTGDIILRPEGSTNSKRHKKWPIVLLIVVLVIALIGAVVWFVSSRERKPDVGAMEKNLYRYTNYLFYGNEDDTRPEENVPSYLTSIYDAVIGKKSTEEYLQHANSLIEQFSNEYYANYTTGSSDIDAKLKVVVDNLNQQFSSVKQYAEIEDLDYGEMIQIYLARGAESLQKETSDRYKALSESHNTNLISIAENKNLLASYVVAIYNIYSASGCIQNGALDATCAQDIVTTEEILQAQQSVQDISLSINDSVQSLISGTTGSAWNAIVAFSNQESLVEKELDENDE